MQGPEVRSSRRSTSRSRRASRSASRRRRSTRAASSGNYRKAVEQRRGARRARAGSALPKGADTLEGFLFPATYELAGRRHGARPGRQAARRVPTTTSASSTSKARAAQEPDRVRRRDDRLADRARDALRQGAPADLVGDLQPAARRASRSASTRRRATTRRSGTGSCSSPSSADDNPYNTRLNGGLPPTPIGEPGLASLKAAAKPAKTDFLFYMAKPGACHAFAEDPRGARARTSPRTRRRARERRQGAAAEVLTTYLGVAGWPVAHSRSPGDAQRRAARRRACAAGATSSCRCRPQRFAETVRALPAAGFRGINVTIPHKEAALALADEATRRRGRRRRGEHAHLRARRARCTPTTPTCPGLLEALPGRPGRARRRSCSAPAARRGPRCTPCTAPARPTCWSGIGRRERAERLVAELGGRVVDAPEAATLIVNCTSVGLRADDQPFKSLPLRRRYVGRRKLRGGHGLQARWHAPPRRSEAAGGDRGDGAGDPDRARRSVVRTLDRHDGTARGHARGGRGDRTGPMNPPTQAGAATEAPRRATASPRRRGAAAPAAC